MAVVSKWVASGMAGRDENSGFHIGHGGSEALSWTNFRTAQGEWDIIFCSCTRQAP